MWEITNNHQKLFENRTEENEYRFDKLSQFLGINISGESVPIKNNIHHYL